VDVVLDLPGDRQAVPDLTVGQAVGDAEDLELARSEGGPGGGRRADRGEGSVAISETRSPATAGEIGVSPFATERSMSKSWSGRRS
jgi:hypothetical protein